MSDLQIMLSAVVAAVTILSFLINFVFLPWNNKRIRLYIEANQKFKLMQWANGVQNTEPIIDVKVINESKNPVFIEEQSVKLPRTVDGGNYFKEIPTSGQFPKKVEPGEPVKFEVDVNKLYEGALSKLNNSESVKVAIKDAKNQMHYSKKIKTKELVELLTAAKSN
jgi:hypothetical protein